MSTRTKIATWLAAWIVGAVALSVALSPENSQIAASAFGVWAATTLCPETWLTREDGDE